MIPEIFHSHDSKAPFTHCLVCNKSLVDPPVQYMVEKCFRQYPGHMAKDVIYEYAMCLNCISEQRKYLSEESMNRIVSYMSMIPMEGEPGKNTVIPDRCVVYHKPVNEMKEYIIQGLFNGNVQDPSLRPLILGEDVIADMQELLSAKTRDGMDDFIDRYFLGPPESREILRKRKVIL